VLCLIINKLNLDLIKLKLKIKSKNNIQRTEKKEKKIKIKLPDVQNSWILFFCWEFDVKTK
jgi:hypothetical protein